jgi:lipoprotein-releasing system ATP-binding protein
VAEAHPSAVDTLQLTGLRKSYGAGTPVETEVLHGIDLKVRHGQFAALIGPSGSGKTTLLNLIGLLDRPNAGRVVISGQDAGSLDETALTRLRGRSIGFIFQYHYLLPAFTALENVMMPMLAARGSLDASMRETAAVLLDQVGLTPWRDHKASDISGGQQQRVAIAGALLLQREDIARHRPRFGLRHLRVRRHVPGPHAVRAVFYLGGERRDRLTVAVIPFGDIDKRRASLRVVGRMAEVALIFCKQGVSVLGLCCAGHDECTTKNHGDKLQVHAGLYLGVRIDALLPCRSAVRVFIPDDGCVARASRA